VGAVGKIHCVSHLDSQTERSPEPLKTGSWVYGEMGSTTADAGNRIAYGSRRYGAALGEIDESKLPGHEELEWTGRLKLRSK